MSDELRCPTHGATHIPEPPHYRTAAPSIALLIRVAEGSDQWAMHDDD